MATVSDLSAAAGSSAPASRAVSALVLYVHTYILMADRVLHGEPCSELDPRGTALGASGRRFHGTAAVTADPALPSRQTQSGQHETSISLRRWCSPPACPATGR